MATRINHYSRLTGDALVEHFSNYLIDSWSYSKVSCFSRNEKAFEKEYVYCEREKRSISSIAGNAYHKALEDYFKSYALNNSDSVLVDLTKSAYDYLDNVPVTEWKLTDKFATVEAAGAEAIRVVNCLIEHFVAEVGTYMDNIDSVIAVEDKNAAWVTVNGVDVPLPLHYVIDLVVRTKDGKNVIVDHKSKSKFTDPDEVSLVHGKQAVSYILGWENNHPEFPIDEVWFIENKITTNRDKSAQLFKIVITADIDTRILYEALLYEPLRRMIEAVSDPDYIYTVNDTDNLSDRASLYEFWTRTLISEVDDFANVPEDKKDLIAKRQRKIKESSVAMITPSVITAFRKKAASFITYDYSHSNMTPSEKIEHAFLNFGKQVRVAHTLTGFSCDTYLCDVAAGVQLNRLNSYAKNIAYVLDVPSIRIPQNLVVYQDKSYLAIEVNKRNIETLDWNKDFLQDLKIPLGLDNYKNPVVWNLNNQSTPHALLCGASGSGKSVSIRSTIAYAKLAGIEQIIILDPKYEFCDYAGDGISVNNEIEDIETILEGLVEEMNFRIKNRVKKLTLVIFDEFADAQDQSKEYHRKNKDSEIMPMEVSFKMLLQKGRSCGFRFLAATQRADTKTISGTTKANFAVLCCLRMPKDTDSRVVLGENGAEALAGHGDGLIKSPEYMDRIIRFQGFYINN